MYVDWSQLQTVTLNYYNLNLGVFATFGKILGDFSPIVPPSTVGVHSRHFRHEGHLVVEVGMF